MKSLLRRIFRDFGLKLAAIFLATALFLHVRKEGIRAEFFLVPIDWSGTAPSGTVFPDSGLVRVRASARDLDRIRQEGARLHLTRGVSAGRLWPRPSSSDLVLPDGVRPLETLVLDPLEAKNRSGRGVR